MMFNQNLQRGMKHSFKVITPDESDTTFDDVKGCDEVREELEELIEYLKNPSKFSKLGAKLPKGILLAGSPGTGKTLLARALASEAGVPFIHASGSEFEEMFVGVGARRIRDLFKTARTISPCIVFIDELDAVGSKRSSTDHNSVRMTLNQLLVELDGFAKQEGIVVLCATNFPESLDPALVRPGRLDKTVYIPLPDLKGRFEILKLYASKMVMSNEIDLNTLAKRTVGMTGADLFNILNTAALKCSMQGLSSVTAAAVEEAFDRVVVGLKGKPLINERERKSTAYHEGGHTLVSLHTGGATKVHKATILPRGNTLGVTWKIPEEKKDTRMNELKAEIDVLMGGMAAEEVIYGKENVTTGCQSDLKKATEIAKTLVMQFGVGLKDVVGPMFVDNDSYHELSEELRRKIDATVQSILDKVVGVDVDDYGTKSVLVTAAWANLNFDFEVAQGTCCASQAKKDAFSELKHAVTIVLDKNLGTFCGHVSVCRYLMDHVCKGTDDLSVFLKNDTSSWLEFFYSRLDFETKLDKTSVVTKGSNSDLAKVVVSINNYLATKTFLVAEKLGPADLVLAVTVDHLVHHKRLDADFVEKDLFHLARFLRTVRASDPYQKFLKMVEKFKTTGSLNDKLNGVEKPAEPAKKPKNPMDLLPPSSFSLDQWKKTYSNCKGDLYKGVMPWLWDHYDPQGWSLYFMVYNKLEDECKSEVFTSNMLSGFLQRFENDLRHYSFAVLNVLGTNGDFNIKGVWLVRGTELPALVTEHPSYEFHTFTKLDPNKPSDKKLVEDYFCACDDIDGVPIADCKVWK